MHLEQTETWAFILQGVNDTSTLNFGNFSDIV